MHRLKTGAKVIGTKQTLRALEKDLVTDLFVARDAQTQVTLRVLEVAKTKGIPVIYVDTMVELAKACEVEVKTATAALMK